MKRDSFLLCCRNMLIRELAAVWVAVLLCHLQLTGSQVSGRLLFRYGFFRWHRGRHCFTALRFLLPFFFSIENLPFSYFHNSTRIHHFSPRNKIFRWNSNSWKFTNWSVKLWWQFYTNFSRIIPFLLNEVNRQTDLIKNEQKLENSIRYKNRLRLELLIDGKWWSRCKRRRGGFSPRILLEKLSQGLRSNWLGFTGVATSCLAVCPGRGVCGVCERWKWISARV